MIDLSESLIKRFWSYVEQIPFHECWEWTGFKLGGYGRISTTKNGPRLLAHRVSLEVNGQKLIPGLVVDHICRNKGCVNPRHLRQVSQRTNVIENSSSRAAKNAQKTHCKYGHSLIPENIFKNSKKPWLRQCKICHKRIKHEWHKRTYVPKRTVLSN